MRTPTCVLGGAGVTDRVTYGHDADRFVEIGSLTKVLTGTVLARLATAGDLGFDTPLEECLDEVPRGTGITLLHLAEHTSGLPRLPVGLTGPPTGLPTAPPDDPYAGFTETALRESLRDLDRLTAGRTGREEYSNLGYAVLGLALTTVTGCSYQRLVDTHVLVPLGLGAGTMTAAPPEERRLVPRDLFGRPRPLWTMTGAILPAGGLWSSCRTLADLVVALLVERRFGEPAPSWQRGPSLRWHDGATRGSSVVAAAYDDGHWILVHRLGDVTATAKKAKHTLRTLTAPPAGEAP
ncbi:serine hydrolase [Streptomyces caniscabiei]|uniref:Beta-lactamase family protein n=1 Tax=Streptomyces caniscabiei TaxID=2746961 RepID=A0A927QLQ6_9ACTN|nr:serine hydrolase domain-containing protein [Streptomyces caniscabiei]MBD9725084.1 beta-lactamase family protein [Streptomyces caniscabiei]MDX3510344.1 serine hydrolase [Streptomyces caniscabiei]MDX3720428.1 serine hydrolase [Streptomyces caniscabiei]WEO26271.1 serine hydrolase [Streptomyces caniscabiei]